MNKISMFRIFTFIIILLSVFVLNNSCDEGHDYELFDYGDDIGQYYYGNTAVFDESGGWLIEIDEGSDIYGCSVYVPENAVQDVTVTMAIYEPEIDIEREDYPDFEPKWIRFSPNDITFGDTVNLGLSFAHLPHGNIWIMNVLQYIPETKGFKVHPIADSKASEEVVYIDVLELGIFAVFPSHK
ncbi:MAG: hypothetical protein KAH17_06830 [Bacteroidales bacterium]|nr:hypothetical protein [Bacteroidales bacterium]